MRKGTKSVHSTASDFCPILPRMGAYILALILAWPEPWGIEESPDARRERLEVAAEAMATAVDWAVMTGRWKGPRRELARALVATVRRESGWLALPVHEGSKLGPAGSICFAQIHPSNSGAYRHAPGRTERERWRSLGGTDPESSLRCAWAGVQSLTWHRSRCPSWESAFSRYMRGNGCSVLEEGARRARIMRSLRRRGIALE